MRFRIILIALLTACLGGCVAHAHGTPTIAVGSTVSHGTILVVTPPPRVFHEGKWLHYRSHAYYYRHNNVWVIASSVPPRVAHHHRALRQPGPDRHSTHSDRTVRSDRTNHDRPRNSHATRNRRQH